MQAIRLIFLETTWFLPSTRNLSLIELMNYFVCNWQIYIYVIGDHKPNKPIHKRKRAYGLVSDRPGWWNLSLLNGNTSHTCQVYPGYFMGPHWNARYIQGNHSADSSSELPDLHTAQILVSEVHALVVTECHPQVKCMHDSVVTE